MLKKSCLLLLVPLLLVSCKEEFIEEPTPLEQEQIVEVTKMEFFSTVFEDGGKIPSKYTCDGEDINPPLMIRGVPAEAKGLVLIMDDPDAVAVAGKVWDHWVVYNIPAGTTQIEEGKEPEGRLGKNGRGSLGYAGPCPPDKEHRYFFKLYALDTELDIPEGRSKQDVVDAMEGHIIEEIEIIGRYSRT